MPKPKRTQYKRNCDYCGTYYEGAGIRFCSRGCSHRWRKEHPKVPASIRFWLKVGTTHPDGCWLWTGGKNSQGYGNFYTNNKQYKAHRFVYELTYGAIPKDILICHHCDNPSCVRPDHLFAGTNQDNMDDMVAKGRSPAGMKGERHPLSKLTGSDIVEIRNLAKQKVPKTQIADKFSVHQTLISNIIRRKTWTHI